MRSVLLIDDHPVVRQGMARILASTLPDLRLSEADTGEEALERLSDRHWDLIILDLTLPGDSGVSLLRRLHLAAPAAPILVVSMHPADQFARRTLQAGAAGYVTKMTDPDEFVRAVGTVLKGGVYLPKGIATDTGAERAGKPHEALSDREYQVLRMIGTGKTVSEIAIELSLSVKTISTYRSRILEKMKMRTSAELMHYVIENRLVG